MVGWPDCGDTFGTGDEGELVTKETIMTGANWTRIKATNKEWLPSTTNDSAQATIEYRLLRNGLMEIQWADLATSEARSEGEAGDADLLAHLKRIGTVLIDELDRDNLEYPFFVGSRQGTGLYKVAAIVFLVMGIAAVAICGHFYLSQAGIIQAGHDVERLATGYEVAPDNVGSLHVGGSQQPLLSSIIELRPEK
ncbi:hypothetical protein B0J15DRAFT_539708 [Fusarium solani]|uniref:Uncharacterized protein n=1 Tax=Fusarium solani TaxID=169388 RepID=A0A9P9FXN1_FUSSL|nr:uncharacterized protein B0J15DRAFT_539708 [Fusarium solani]KAH7227273.1 hypothetical protein B0J15DRAFT_539708 [Fusarium solani]